MSDGAFWRSPSIVTTISPPGARDAGVHRRVLAVVSVERHHPQARVRVVQAREPVEGRVGRPVVDEDHLAGDARAWSSDSTMPRKSGSTVASSSSTGTTTLTSGSAAIGQGYRWPATPALADNPAPMFTRAQVRALAAERWPALLGGVAVVGYAILVVGFGLDFRPLHHDEVVTLHVAGQPSARDVLHVGDPGPARAAAPLPRRARLARLAPRHPRPAPSVGPLRHPRRRPGLRLRARADGPGGRGDGRRRHRGHADHDPPRPVRARLHGDDRLRVREPVAHARAPSHGPGPLGGGVRPGSRCSSWRPHPFGLFALASELVLLAGLGGYAIATRRRGDRRAIVAIAAGLVLGAGALLWLRHLYSPLQSKYGVGKGGAVVDLTSRSFWSDLASHVTGSSVPAFWFLVGAGRGGSGSSRSRSATGAPRSWPRCGSLLPLLLLQILTASSEDFAPERHLSFLLPGLRDRALRVRARARPPARPAPHRRRSWSSRRSSRRSSCRAGTTSRTSTPICATRASGWRRSSGPTTSC